VTDLDKYLIPSETPVVLTRRHWASMAKTGALSSVALVIGFLLLVYAADSQAAAGVAVAIILGALGWFGWMWWEWHSEEFVITDRRVLLIRGILTRRVAVMPLSKVTDLTYERSLPGRILGYGVFVMESAGQKQGLSRVDYLPTPDKLYHDVSGLLFGVNSPRGYRQDTMHSGLYTTAPLPEDD